jgi:hypothetical protein
MWHCHWLKNTDDTSSAERNFFVHFFSKKDVFGVANLSGGFFSPSARWREQDHSCEQTIEKRDQQELGP